MEREVRLHAQPEQQHPPECLNCRYDLTGFSIGQTCPECGQGISAFYLHPSRATLGDASVILGTVSFLCVGLGCIFWPLFFVFLGTSWAGMICALLCRHRTRKHPYGFARSSIIVARIGFWMSVPGVVLTTVAAFSALYAAVI